MEDYQRVVPTTDYPERRCPGEIDREARSNLPVVLEIERGLFRLVGDRRVNGNPTVIAKAEKQVGKRVPLSDIEVERNLFGDVLREVKITRWKWWLPKVGQCPVWFAAE